MQSAETTSPSSSRELPPGIRIALGAIARSQGGPRTYALELLDALTTRYPEACWSLITEDRTPFTVRDTIVKGCRFDELPMAHPALRPLWERRALPRGIAAGRAQLYHGTKNTVPAGLAIPSVVTVHDLAPFLMPETFPRLSGLYLRRSIRASVRRATRVIAVSHATQRDLIEVLDVPAARIDVVHHGLAERDRTLAADDEVSALRRELELDGPLVLCVGTVQPRKNQLAVLRAFQSVQRHLPSRTRCLFVGRPGWGTAPFEQAIANASPDSVRWLRSFPDQRLRALYRAADVFVSPSDYEGFGLTFLEAMSQGTPVIAVARGAAPEVIGKASLLLDEATPEAIGTALRELLADREARGQWAERAIARARTFSWQRSAEGHAASYLAALGSP